MLASRVLSRHGLFRPALRTAPKATLTSHNTTSTRYSSTSGSIQLTLTNNSQSSLRKVTSSPLYHPSPAIRWQSNTSNGSQKPPSPSQKGPIDPNSQAHSRQDRPPDSEPPSSQTIDVDSQSPGAPGKIKLPDLRQGIPSTFAEEYLKNKPGKESTETSHELDITDQEAGADHTRPGGGGRGEIPKSAYETSIDKRRAAVARYFYIAWALLMVGGGVYYGRNWDTEEEERAHPDVPSGWGPSLMYNRIKTRVNEYLGYYTEPTFPKLLPTVKDQNIPPYTLVISLDDMLVHSEWSREHGWRTAKRPGVDFFLLYLSQYYELCLFTSVQFAMADPIVKKLDPYHIIMWPLFREATRYENGDYVKACNERISCQKDETNSD
jgi:mitochondrial import inner membrane translocase subunit TIM50